MGEYKLFAVHYDVRSSKNNDLFLEYVAYEAARNSREALKNARPKLEKIKNTCENFGARLELQVTEVCEVGLDGWIIKLERALKLVP